MHLDLPELGVPVACVAKAGDQHPLQDRVKALVLRIDLLPSLGLDPQGEKRGEDGDQEPLQLRVLDCLRGEVVFDYDRGVERGEVDLVDPLVDSRLGLEDHPTLVAGPQLADVPQALCILLLEGDGHSPAQGLEYLVAGDERSGSEPGGEIRGKPGQPSGQQDSLQPALCIDEALCGVYQDPALWYQGAVLVLDLALAPVGLRGHLLVLPAPADGGL